MALWNADLTTEDGALGAAQMGGAACFVAAGLTVFGLVFMWGMIRVGAIMPLIGMIALLEAGLFTIAGFRLRGGKGAVWGGVAALLLAAELLMKLAAMALMGIAINAILLIVVINGIRGAIAMQKGGFGAESDAEIFS